MRNIFSIILLVLLLPACGSLRYQPSRATHVKARRNPRVVARTPAALKGEPLAYELDQARFSWPVSTTAVSSLFGERWGRPHEGVDIAAPKGTPVKAARAGKVIYASNGINGYGNMVVIRHSPSFATVYAHLSRFAVRAGDFVERGKTIGKVGMTGRATSPHLHFEIRHKRLAVDPLLYLPGRYAFSGLKK